MAGGAHAGAGTAFGLALATTMAASAAVDRPAPGAFAFDWLQPKTARCRPLTAADVARFRTCERQPGAFGLADPVHACRVGERSEFLVFASRAACDRNLQAMKAHAP